MDKIIKKYAGMYQSAIKRKGLADAEGKTREYITKLTEMYASEAYRRHDIYPTMQVSKVYAVIAMCLMLKGYGLKKDEIIDIVNDAFRKPKKIFYCIEKIVDIFPITWKVVKKWNISDYKSRVEDGSVTYDFFTVEDNRVSYRISGCKYVEMFDFYGIRELCKIFCMTDTQAYDNLTRHIQFVRYSDLSDGDCCRDDVLKK